MIWKAFIVTAAIYFAIAWYGKTYGFGAQCEAAGYKSAALERCINRKVSGGPTFEENAREPPQTPSEHCESGALLCYALRREFL